MIEWLDDFYGSDEFRAALGESVRPLLLSYAADVIDGPVDEAFLTALIASYIDHYLDSSRAQLQEVLKDAENPAEALSQRFSEWKDKRPGKESQRELIRLREALSMAQMQAQGVERKVWQTRGGSCPYCTSMNGRSAEVSGDFFSETDALQPEGADRPLTFNRSIAHPPLHDGCDCTLSPA